MMRRFDLATIALALGSTASADLGDQLFQLGPGGPYQSDYAGISVAMNGRTAIVGAQRALGGGAGFGFELQTGEQVATFNGVTGWPTDLGCSVAISGTTVLAGALNAGVGREVGAAYVFDLTTGTQLFELQPPVRQTTLCFGNAVAMSGTIGIVGAMGDSERAMFSGAVHIVDCTTGQHLRKLHPNDPSPWTWFGSSVAVSGTTIVVGTSERLSSVQGAAYTFNLNTGEQIAKLRPPAAVLGDRFGHSVAISGNRVIVGSLADAISGGAGAAYIFDATTGHLLATLVPSDGRMGDQFGSAVGISGTTAVVGAQGVGGGAGAAYVFDVTTSEELEKLKPREGGMPDDRFGASVAISGGRAVIGSPATLRPGAAYVFDISRHPRCAANWNADHSFNTSDLLAYMNDYHFVQSGSTPMHADPDLAPPVGVVDARDFLAYLTIYVVGCP